MQDRVSLYPGRVKLVPVAGQENTYDMVRADSPMQEGTPLNKGSLLKDTTAALLGLGADAVPDDALKKLSGKLKIVEKDSGRIKLVGESDTYVGKSVITVPVWGGTNLSDVSGYYCISPNKKYLAKFVTGTAKMYLYRLPDMELIGSITTTHSTCYESIVMDDNFGCIATYTGSSSAALEFFEYTDTSITKVSVTGVADNCVHPLARYHKFAIQKTNPKYFWVITNTLNADPYAYKLVRISKVDKSAVSIESGTFTDYGSHSCICRPDGADGCYTLETDFNSNSSPRNNIVTILKHYSADGTATTLFSIKGASTKNRVAPTGADIDIDNERVVVCGYRYSSREFNQTAVLNFSGNVLHYADIGSPNTIAFADGMIFFGNTTVADIDTLTVLDPGNMLYSPSIRKLNNNYWALQFNSDTIFSVPVGNCFFNALFGEHRLYADASAIKMGGFVNE